jgi:hypothetical protein
LTVRENWERLQAGISGIVQLQEKHVPDSHKGVVHKLPSQVAGIVNTDSFQCLQQEVRLKHKAG